MARIRVGIVGCGEVAKIIHLPIHLTITRVNGEGGVTRQNIHPAWGDPFVIEWQDFYHNIQHQKEPKTSPSDFRNDLELFQAMVRLIQDRIEQTAA
jgi:predicted dehydrogenase